ncbi:hypothetical protein AB1Y20_002409 [Prymnesium parvum]|uniref:Uncharacterized protein n=1 Tax=Prymnesium parvum TaxID=97485 RepID=A0AB34JAZ7_PRYPA
MSAQLNNPSITSAPALMEAAISAAKSAQPHETSTTSAVALLEAALSATKSAHEAAAVSVPSRRCARAAATASGRATAFP